MGRFHSADRVLWPTGCAVLVAAILQGCGQTDDVPSGRSNHVVSAPSKFRHETTTSQGPLAQSGDASTSLATTSTVTTTKLQFNEGCSKKGEDCRFTECCYDPGTHCYQKDYFFASCKHNCTPGLHEDDPAEYRMPWSCIMLEPKPKSCAGENRSCSSTTCCSGLTCYEKDATWSGCKQECTPGVDPTDPPNLRTPWSCSIRSDLTPASAPGSAAAAPQPLEDEDIADSPTTSAEPPRMEWLETHCNNKTSVEGHLRVQGISGDTYAQGGGGEVSPNTLTLHHNSGYSLMTTCRAMAAPTEFVQFKLIGKTISFLVDLSRVGCACNLAFYLVSAPALDPAGVPSLGECDESPYYCDANRVCNQWCTEIDIMEANTHVFQATPHKCDAPSSTGHFGSCDRGGCAQNTRDIPGVYGPGQGHTINTMHPFNVSTSFPGEGNTLRGMVTTLTQNGRKVVLNHYNCDPSYMAQVGASLSQGMALRITYWGDKAETMSWMDMPPCGGEPCSASGGHGIISDIVVDPPQVGAPTRHLPGVKPRAPPLPPVPPKPVTTRPPVAHLTPTPSLHPSLRPSPSPSSHLTFSRPPSSGPATSKELPPTQPSSTMTWWWVALPVLLCLLLYLSAVLLLWCCPSLRPVESSGPVDGPAESALYASGASSRELLTTTGVSQMSEISEAVGAVNTFIFTKLCCSCRPFSGRAPKESELVQASGQ